MATKIIKFNNGTYTYAPVTLASAVQYSYDGGVMSVQDAIGTLAKASLPLGDHLPKTVNLTYTSGSGLGLSGVHADGTKVKIDSGTGIKIESISGGIKISNTQTSNVVQYLTGSGTALSSATNSSVAYVKLDSNHGKVGIQGTAGTSAVNKVGQAEVIIAYDTTSWYPNNIRIKVSYKDTNTNYYDTIIDKGLTGYTIAEITATGTGSSTAIHVPQATSSHLGVVQLGYTDANKGYALKLDKDGKGYVNVPWTDTVPDYSNTYAPILHVKDHASTIAYGHVVVDASINGTSENPVQNKAINTALSGKAATGHTHTLNWTTNAKTTDAGTEIAALVAVPSSGTYLGQSAGTATFTTYTLPTKKYVDNKIGDIGSALNFKGTVGPNETQKALPTSGVKVGDVWLVKLVSGTNSSILSGQTLENGDMIIATNSSPVAWTVVNANWTATDGTQSVTVGASSPTTLATIGGVAIDIKVDQEANVVHKSDLNTYVNGLNTATGTGVVTGAKLETNGGGQKLTLTYTDLRTEMRVGSLLDTIIEFKQNAQGKITNVTTAPIATMKPATASAAGTKGFVPDPPAGSQNKVLTGAATFKAISASQGAHATGLIYKTMDTSEEFTLFDDSAFTGAAVSLATIASPAITVSLS